MPVEKIDKAPKMFGAYVENVSSSIGWNGQGGSCQLTLVEDPENGVNISLPEVGTACYFKFHEFYYGGIFQRWTYKEEIGGKKYDVILESPGGKILNGVNVILSGFEGTAFNEGDGYDKINPSSNPNFTTQIKNVWNPYGHKENYAFGGRFGAANTNSAGFLARELLELLELISRGESDFGGKIKYGESEYELDTGDLKEVTEYFRVSGQSATLNTIFQECAEVLQYDYFADVEPKDGKPAEDGGGPMANPVIKIRTIDKTMQPDAGAVRKLVEESKANKTLASSDVGQELSDEVTQRVVVGGPASRYYMANINECIPVWGKLGPKSYVIAPNFNRTPAAYQPSATVPIVLDEMSELGGGVSSSILSGYLGNTYNATVMELRMALGGMEHWLTFKVFESFYKGTYANDPWVCSIEPYPNVLQKIANRQAGALSLAATSYVAAIRSHDKDLQEYVKKIFDKVSKTANEFYGRMFLIPLPYEPGGLSNNLKFVEEDLVEVASWDISSDAWVSNKPVGDINFYNSGRLKSVSVYPFSGNSDFSEMGADYAAFINNVVGQPVINGICTTKTGFQDANVFFMPQIAPNPFIVADTGLQVKQFDQYTTIDAGITFLSNYFFGINVPPENYLTPGKSSGASVSVHPRIDYPDWIGVPQQSIRYSWGPWYKSSSDKGKSEVVIDTSLVPENFGSVATMNDSGKDAAGAGIAELGANESGRVELAEFPRFSIADRFNSSGPYITGMSISIGVGGFTTSYEFNTWTPNFGKLTKYNSDRISRIYKAGLDALKRFADDNPKRPFRPIQFGKSDPKQKSDKQKENRDSAEFALFRKFNNVFEASQMKMADAFGLSVSKNGVDSILNNFGCSEEQKWSPVGIEKEKGGRPGIYLQKPLRPSTESVIRFSDGVGPSANDLDPYFSKAIYNGDQDKMINSVDFVSAVNASQNSYVPSDFNLSKSREAGGIDEVRTVGLRGPMLLSGWGYDIAGNPTPSQDNENFWSAAIEDRTFWNTGPVNLLWDHERKVWSGGLEMLCGVLTGPITKATSATSPSTFTVKILRKTSTANTKGAGALSFSGETVTCYNRDVSLEQELVDDEDVFVMIVRMNYEWMPFWVGCP